MYTDLFNDAQNMLSFNLSLFKYLFSNKNFLAFLFDKYPMVLMVNHKPKYKLFKFLLLINRFIMKQFACLIKNNDTFIFNFGQILSYDAIIMI